MNIYEALEVLDKYLEKLSEYGDLTDKDCDTIGEAENIIYQFARKYEPKAEDLLTEFTCDCGTHMTRNRITDGGDAEFICSKCNAVWLLGRPF